MTGSLARIHDKLKPEIKEIFIAALESGDYKPAEGTLRTTSKKAPRHCCLGVLEECAVKAGVYGEHGSGAFKFSSVWPTAKTLEWAGMDTAVMHALGNINDDEVAQAKAKKKRATYDKVIKYIKDHL
jgi:hypothetical protein